MILAEHSVGCPLKLGWMNSNIRDKGVTLVREPRVTNPSRLCQWTQSPSQFCYLCLVRLVIHGSSKMRYGPTNVAQDGTERRASPRRTGPHAVTHPLPLRLIIFSHPHIPTQTPHTQKILLVPLFPPPLHIHTQGNGISHCDVISVSLSL